MVIKAEFDRAVTAAKQKDFHSARTILRDILKEDPQHVDAWILFAHVAQTREHAIYCFERALFLEHDNTYIRQQLTRLRADEASAQEQPVSAARQSPDFSEGVQPETPGLQPAANVSLLSNKPDAPKRKKLSRLEIILLVILILAVLILIGAVVVNALQGM